MRSVALLLLFTAAGFAGDWIRVRSQNFDLFTTAGEKRGREALVYFEQVRSLFVRLWPGAFRSEVPATIIAFSNEKEYRPYRMNEFATAYYLPYIGRDYIVIGSLTSESFPLVVHEYTHLMAKHAKFRFPPWLNEGFADVQSTLKQNGDKLIVGDALVGRLLELRNGKWLPLDRLLAVEHDSPEYNEKKRAGMFYAQSWLLTHMLYLSDSYRPKFGQLAGKIAAGSPVSESLRELYGKSVQEVEADLKKYSNSSSINALAYEAKLLKPEEQPKSEPAPEVELQISLATLLSRTAKPDEGMRTLQDLSKRFPQNWQVAEALGTTSLYKRDSMGARLNYAKAVELGDDNPDILFQYAQMLQGDPAKDSDLIAALKKAIARRPDFSEASLLLGATLYNSGKYKEAILALSEIKRVDPDRAPLLFMVMAQSYARMGYIAPARDAAEKLKRYAKTDYDRQAADQVLEFLNRPTETQQVAAADQSKEYERPASASLNIVQPGEKFADASGTLRKIECLGQAARLLIQTAEGELALLIRDPNRITIRNSGGNSIELQCGASPNSKISVRYLLKPDAALKTAGDIRELQF